jgi:zinc transporter ZupT
MDLLVFCALFFPVAISGLSVFLFRTNNRVLKLLTAFSGAYLLAISFLDVIPEIYQDHNGVQIGAFILLGFFIQLLLEFITKGVEHGHPHHDCHEHHPHQQHSKPHLPIIPVVIGLFIHAFIEGMPLAENFNMPELRNTLLMGIAIHNIPIAIVLVSLTLDTQKRNFIRPVISLLIFALAGPLGVLTGSLLGGVFAADTSWYFSMLMAIVVGIFFHISTTILFETDENHRFNWMKFLSILLGAGAAFLFSMQVG